MSKQRPNLWHRRTLALKIANIVRHAEPGPQMLATAMIGQAVLDGAWLWLHSEDAY